MPAQKGNILLPLISAVAVIGLIAAGYFFYSAFVKTPADKPTQEQSSNTNFPTPIPTVTQDETANWNQIRNDILATSFKLPRAWKEIEHSSNYPNLLEFVAPDKSQIRIEKVMSKLSLEEYLAEKDQLSKTAYEGTPSIETQSSTRILVNGQQAIRRTEHWLSAGFSTDVVYTRCGSGICQISILPYAEYPLTFKQMEATKLFDQLLSTFRFL